jgi:peptide/nickel transport system substrate-binding protein
MQQQVYEPLLMYNGTSDKSFIPMLADWWPGYDNTSNGRWPTPEGPIPGVSPAGTVFTYRFELRPNVPWQDPSYGDVTGPDVVYSLDRGMLQDSSMDVMWLLYTPLTGASTADSIDPMFTNSTTGKASISDATTYDELLCPWIEGAIQCYWNGTDWWVVFNLPAPYPAFPQILTQSWAFVTCKAWDIKQGCMWMGAYENTSVTGLGAWHFAGDTGILHFAGIDNYANYTAHACALGYAPSAISSSPLMNPTLLASSEPMMGSGPYKLIKFDPDPNVGFQAFEANPTYWQGVAKTEYVWIKVVEEWSNRKAQLLSTNPALQCDLADVPLTNAAELITNGTITKGYTGTPIPGLTLTPHNESEADYMFYNYNVSSISPYVPLLGTKPNETLFSDRDLRLAFDYAFNATEFLQDAFFGWGFTPTTFMAAGTLDYNASTVFLRNIDLAKAQYYLNLSWGGSPIPGRPGYATPGLVYKDGLSVVLLYNSGNVERQVIATELSDILTHYIHWGSGATVSITTAGVPWGEYLFLGFTVQCPVFIIGWLADYPDPSDWAAAFLTPTGAYGITTGFHYGYTNYATPNATSMNEDWPKPADYGPIPYKSSIPGYGMVTGMNDSYIYTLVADSSHAPNPTVENNEYQELQDIFYAEANDLPVAQGTGLHFQRDWIQGYQNYSMNPVAVGFYFYQLSKSLSSKTVFYGINLDAVHSVTNTSEVYPYTTCAIVPSISMTTGVMIWQGTPAYINFSFSINIKNASIPIIWIAIGVEKVTPYICNPTETAMYNHTFTYVGVYSVSTVGVHTYSVTFNESLPWPYTSSSTTAGEATNGTWEIFFNALPVGTAGGEVYPINATLLSVSSPYTVTVHWPGDANGDGTVDASDFFLLEKAWGTSTGQKTYDPRVDFNQDGVVDASDFFILEKAWGLTYGTS